MPDNEIVVVVLREREGKAGGGKGPLMSDKAFTLSTSNFHTLFIFEATRVDDVRLYYNYSPTVATYWGTGGARVPYVFPLQGTMIGRADHNGPQGKGYGDEDDPMFTLERVSVHAVAFHTTQDPISGEVSPALGTTSKGMGVVAQAVRRLTPTECERLQGFPDGWTDGQADSHRYKQCGNAVAVPVVQWIIDRLI